ncbi:hypothetical protein [Kocuria rhizophila]|uniref:hypothetical protein n=1 Tax=Kocuria rhizophila TaxID=72000 RepID=UPI00190958E3|nr:hypothetical protein [Kocuria rhizophila]MBK4119706.1 hypothetical protein [Kocuria rhizophila]
MLADPQVTVEATYRNPIPVGELKKFVQAAECSLAEDAKLRIRQDPETGHPTDPGGTITIKATGSPRPRTQGATIR